MDNLSPFWLLRRHSSGLKRVSITRPSAAAETEATRRPREAVMMVESFMLMGGNRGYRLQVEEVEVDQVEDLNVNRLRYVMRGPDHLIDFTPNRRIKGGGPVEVTDDIATSGFLKSRGCLFPSSQNVSPTRYTLAQHRGTCSHEYIRQTPRTETDDGEPEYDDRSPCSAVSFVVCSQGTDAAATTAETQAAVCCCRVWIRGVP